MIFWIIGIGIVLVVGMIFLFAVKGYNSLVILKNRVDNQAAQVDVQLKRRADLIPNMLETTKGYARYEKDTLKSITKLRTQILSAGNIESSYQASETLGRLTTRIIAVGEQYPELKANTNFLQLQQELSETEDKISKSRQFYNDTVLSYNNMTEMFPSNIVASLFKFKSAEFFKIDESEKAAPKVQF